MLASGSPLGVREPMASYDIAPDKLPTPVSMAFKNAKSNSALVRNYAELALIRAGNTAAAISLGGAT